MTDRFPSEQSIWGDQNEKRVWTATLEDAGVEVVTMILNQRQGPTSEAVGIGLNPVLRGFAQEWLAFKHRQAAEEQRKMQAQSLATAQSSARAAKWAAAAAILSFFVACVQVYVAWKALPPITQQAAPPK